MEVFKFGFSQAKSRCVSFVVFRSASPKNWRDSLPMPLSAEQGLGTWGSEKIRAPLKSRKVREGIWWKMGHRAASPSSEISLPIAVIGSSKSEIVSPTSKIPNILPKSRLLMLVRLCSKFARWRAPVSQRNAFRFRFRLSAMNLANSSRLESTKCLVWGFLVKKKSHTTVIQKTKNAPEHMCLGLLKVRGSNPKKGLGFKPRNFEQKPILSLFARNKGWLCRKQFWNQEQNIQKKKKTEREHDVAACRNLWADQIGKTSWERTQPAASIPSAVFAKGSLLAGTEKSSEVRLVKAVREPDRSPMLASSSRLSVEKKAIDFLSEFPWEENGVWKLGYMGRNRAR